MPEWPKGAPSKALYGQNPYRGFESLSLRQNRVSRGFKRPHRLTRRCRMWARQILDYATPTGRRSGENPARALGKDVLAPQRENRPALDEAHAGLFLRRLYEYPGKPETRLAITLLMLTAARPGEIQAARWSEFDLARAEWRLPASRMKARREHRVPLSRQAVEAREELAKFTGAGEYLFPSDSKRAPGEFRHDSIEAALAHAGGDAVRAAYNRATSRLVRGDHGLISAHFSPR